MLPGIKLLVLLPGLLLSAVAASDPGTTEQTLWIASRSVEIPITLALPETGSQPWPLVVMAHGHGGSRDEGGGFARLADMLGERGIASVRMDFPGCGDSRESLRENTIDHMLADLAAAREFALGQAPLDATRTGLLGYSMGGRLAMLSLAEGFSYAAVVLWAPAASNGPRDFHTFLGGVDRYNSYWKAAAQDGYTIITTPWNQQQELSLAWFMGLEDSQPLAAMANYTGPLLVLHGETDEVIPATHSEPIAKVLLQSQRKVIPAGTHGLGFYDHAPSTASLVLSETVEFFSRALSPR